MCNFYGNADGQLAGLHRGDELNLFMFDQMNDARDVHALHAKFLGNLSHAIATVAETFDLTEDVTVRRTSSGNVLDETHQELIFLGSIDHNRWNVGLTQCDE